MFAYIYGTCLHLLTITIFMGIREENDMIKLLACFGLLIGVLFLNIGLYLIISWLNDNEEVGGAITIILDSIIISFLIIKMIIL